MEFWCDVGGYEGLTLAKNVRRKDVQNGAENRPKCISRVRVVLSDFQRFASRHASQN